LIASSSDEDVDRLFACVIAAAPLANLSGWISTESATGAFSTPWAGSSGVPAVVIAAALDAFTAAAFWDQTFLARVIR
jgi:hypothetical protein